MNYRPLLTLQLIHPYYEDGRCPDFAVEPTLATQRQLKNCRAVLKRFVDGVRIFIGATGDGTPVIPLPSDLLFTFQMRLQNPDFALFTDLSEMAQLTAPVFMTRDGGQQAKRPLVLGERQRQASEEFAVQQPGKADEFVLRGQPLAGLQPAAFVVEGLGAVTQISQFAPTSKVIALNTSAARQGQPFTVGYASAPPRLPGVFAEVELTYDSAGPSLADGPQEFTLTFSAKRARWRYYVIAQPSATNLRIEDKSGTPLVFSEANRTDLNQRPDPSDEIANQLAVQYPTLQRWRFASDELVPCQQNARKQIQLLQNGSPVLSALPYPSPRHCLTYAVHENTEKQTEHSLFQVVKLFVDPFAANILQREVESHADL